MNTTKQSWDKKNLVIEALRLLNDPRTGLRDSSDTNKTRYAIVALFDSLESRLREEWAGEIQKIGKKYNTSSGARHAIEELLALLQPQETTICNGHDDCKMCTLPINRISNSPEESETSNW